MEDMVGLHRIAVSPSGKVAGATLNNRLLVLGEEDLVTLGVLDPKESKSLWNTVIHGLVWTEDESSLIVAEGTRLTSVDVETGSLNWRIRLKEYLPFLSLSALTITRLRGGMVAISTEAGDWQVWSPSGALIRKKKDHAAPHSVGLTTAETLLGTDGHVVTEWDVETLEPLRRRLIAERVHSVAPCLGSPLKWWAKVESSLVLMDWEGEEPLVSLPVGAGLPALAVSHDGCEVSWLETNRIMSCVAGSEPRCIMDAEARALSLAYLPDGKIVSGWSDGALRQSQR